MFRVRGGDVATLSQVLGDGGSMDDSVAIYIPRDREGFKGLRKWELGWLEMLVFFF